MDYETLTPDDPRYPRKLRARLKDEAPTLYFNGPLRLLDRFGLGVVCADHHTGVSFLATNELLFKIREYALNYIGPWHAVIETEIFRLALDTPTDPERRRSLTILTARGLAIENWDNFLGDRFGYRGPFTGFPQKEEFYRRARDGELLWLSVTPPAQKRIERKIILQRNRVACALADIVYVPSAPRGSKTYTVVRRALKDGVPIFTCWNPHERPEFSNQHLYDLGIPYHTRKTVGKFLESLGARTDDPPPFEKPLSERPRVLTPPPIAREPRPRQGRLL